MRRVRADGAAEELRVAGRWAAPHRGRLWTDAEYATLAADCFLCAGEHAGELPTDAAAALFHYTGQVNRTVCVAVSRPPHAAWAGAGRAEVAALGAMGDIDGLIAQLHPGVELATDAGALHVVAAAGPAAVLRG
eukprot:gene3248-24878_t